MNAKFLRFSWLICILIVGCTSTPPVSSTPTLRPAVPVTVTEASMTVPTTAPTAVTKNDIPCYAEEFKITISPFVVVEILEKQYW